MYHQQQQYTNAILMYVCVFKLNLMLTHGGRDKVAAISQTIF